MSNTPKLYIAGMGMITPVGFDTASTAAAVRAGVSTYAETDYYDDEYNKIKMAVVPDEALENCLEEGLLQGELTAQKARMLQLAKLALTEIKPKLPKHTPLPLFLAAPEQTGESTQSLNRAFLENLALQTGINLDLEVCRIVSSGRAGGLSAIRLAFLYIESTSAKVVLVGGVDTFYDKERLETLVADKRLLCGEAVDGFVPGEAAAFLLLTNDPSYMNVPSMPRIYEPGIGVENGHCHSKQTYTGDGLSSAMKVAISQADAPRIATIYSSMNGEHFWAKEYGVAVTRNRTALEEHVRHEHPAEFYGDVGAASGPLLVGLAAENFAHSESGCHCLVCCSSDNEFRGAIVLRS